MTDLIANMVVRNEADNYLEQVLTRLQDQVDLICVTDDCSDDNTLELVKSFPKVRAQQTARPIFRENEGQLREYSWQWLEQHVQDADTWVLAIDADEELYEVINPVRNLIQTDSLEVINVMFFHMWNETQFRIDGGWRPHGSTRLFRYHPGGHFAQRKLACFTPETLVRVRDGFKPISQILVGEEVLTVDGSFQKVLETMSRPYDGDVYNFRSKVNPVPVRATPEHPFLSMKSQHSRKNRSLNHCVPWKCERGNGLNFVGGKHKNQIISHEIAWREVGELNRKDWSTIAYPNKGELIDIDWIDIPQEYLKPIHLTNMANKSILPGFKVDGEFLWMVGMYLAEGSSGKNDIRFTLSESETYFVERLKKFFESKGYHVGYSTKNPDSDGCEVIVSNGALAKWFPKWLGHHCNNKNIPKELFNLPNEKIEFLFQGLIDGDGSKIDSEALDNQGRLKNFKGRFKQTSETLCLQAIEILFRLGGRPSAGIEVVEGKFPAYIVQSTVYPYDAKRGFWNMEDKLLTQVEENQISHYTGEVYNLRVAGNNTYVVGSTVVHNCGSEPTYVSESMVDRRFQTYRYIHNSGLFMKHLSYIKDEDKRKKYERYAELDGGAFHAGAHIQSIIDPPEKVTLDTWRWK